MQSDETLVFVLMWLWKDYFIKFHPLINSTSAMTAAPSAWARTSASILNFWSQSSRWWWAEIWVLLMNINLEVPQQRTFGKSMFYYRFSAFNQRLTTFSMQQGHVLRDKPTFPWQHQELAPKLAGTPKANIHLTGH